MKAIVITAIAALLGACSTTTSTPTRGTATFNATGDYIVVQNSASYTLSPNGSLSGVQFLHDPSAASITQTAYGYNSTDVTLVGGRAGDGTYITGLTGTKGSGFGASGTVNLSGIFGLNDNGTTDVGTINLVADLTAGTLTGTSGTTTVNGTINGADIGGTLVHNGNSGTLNGGVYGSGPAPTAAATFSGTNLAGILVAY